MIDDHGSPLTIVFASHTFLGSPFVVGSHHLAREMARLGHYVFHVSSPITPAHFLKIIDPTFRASFSTWARCGVVVNSRLINYVPFSLFPWPVVAALFKGTKINLSTYTFLQPIQKIVQIHGFRPDKIDLLLIDQPRLIGIERYIRASILIYRATDLYHEITGDIATEIAEKTIIKKADGLVGTSEPVVQRIREACPSKPWLLLENGVDYDHFINDGGPPLDYAAIPRPRAIYVGAIDGRLDLPSIRRLAESLPSLHVVMIGPYTKAVRNFFTGVSNVHLIGSKNYSNLPPYLCHADVGLLPLSDHPANVGRSPIKLYEYAASGLPVVAKETPELLRRREPFLNLYSDGSHLPVIVQELLQRRSDRDKIRASARTHSWRNKVKVLLEFALDIGVRSDKIKFCERGKTR